MEEAIKRSYKKPNFKRQLTQRRTAIIWRDTQGEASCKRI